MDAGGSASDAGDIESDAGDAGDAAPPLPLPMPDWDAGATLEGPPIGLSYAEVPGSFKLIEPKPLAQAYALLASDTGNARLFLQSLDKEETGGISVEYGAAFIEDEGAVYQYPNEVGTFRVAPSVESSTIFVSDPFDYRLYAWVPKPGNPDVGYRLQLSSRNAIWTARFSADFEHIEEGSLIAVVTRTEAESAPMKLDALTCLAACSNPLSCTGGLETLAGLLDCNDTKLNADVDGDGTLDGYRLRIEFAGERVTMQ